LTGIAANPGDWLSRDHLRQRAVQRMSVRDWPPEERFDRLTRLAVKVFDVTAAMIAVVDTDRTVCVSRAGVPMTDNCDLLCRRTVADEALLVVGDAGLDHRFAGRTEAQGESGVRFFAGAPLADADGLVVGVFCVCDSRARSLGAREIEVLLELAGWAQEEVVGSPDTRRAREVQQKLLPREVPEFAGYDLAALCLPAQTVGGDFYDYRVLGQVFEFCLADVMGKGTGAAILTATVRAAMRTASRRGSPASVLTEVNHAILRDLEATGSLVTGFAAYIDGPSGLLNYVDAGHGLTVVVGEDAQVRWLESSDLPMGVQTGSVWAEQRVMLAPGDTLLCFSDGLLDLYGTGREALDGIADVVVRHRDPRELTAHFRTATAWGAATDDVTLLALRRR
jgi:hypothetical protein